MIFLILFTLSFSISDGKNESLCKSFGENCESCFMSGSGICGWCRDSSECLSGDQNGPFNASGADWSYTFDMICHLESAKPISDTWKIIIYVFTSTVAVSTAVFWICIYPACFTIPKESGHESTLQDQGYQMQ